MVIKSSFGTLKSIFCDICGVIKDNWPGRRREGRDPSLEKVHEDVSLDGRGVGSYVFGGVDTGSPLI